MEELRMMPVYQVFIMVLIQGARRSGFHHRMDLFILNFATKVPQEVVFTKALFHFSFFHFFHFFIFHFFLFIFFIFSVYLERAQVFTS